MTPSRERVLQLFNYNPETGAFLLKLRDRSEFSSDLTYSRHLKRVGKPCGGCNRDGYVKLHVDGIYRRAHRLAWLITYNEWPEYPLWEIDHINGDRADNRICNLRKVSKSENQRNTSTRSNNTSGVHGVNWKAGASRWVARIWAGERHVYLGQFKTLREAEIARKAAERALGYTVREAAE